MSTRLYSKYAPRYVHLGIDPDAPIATFTTETGTGTGTGVIDALVAYAGLHSYPIASGNSQFSLVLSPDTTFNPSSGLTDVGYATVVTDFSVLGNEFNTVTFILVGTDSYETVCYGVDSEGPGSATDSLDRHRQYRQGLNAINDCGDVFMGGILVYLQPAPGNYNDQFGVPIPCCSGNPIGIQPSGPRVPEQLKLLIRHPNIGVPGPCECIEGTYVIHWKGGHLWEAIGSCGEDRIVLTVGCITFFDGFGNPSTGFILRIKCGDDPPIFSAISSGSCQTVDSTVDKPYKHVEILWGGTIEILGGSKCCPILGSGSGSVDFSNHYGWSVTIL